MTKSGKIWVVLCVIFSSVFAVLFFPIAVQEFGFVVGTILTVLGVVVIWFFGLLRGYFFGLRWKDLTDGPDAP